ncbi:MAG: hypothetical protein U9R43_11580 [Thermodesulfobacteriota bacterium]|nr:hypothetical protein [Thermodesulfobacteriota bacterium]
MSERSVDPVFNERNVGKLESGNSGQMTHASPLATQGKTHASPLASVYASQLRLDKTQGKAQAKP